MPTSQRLPVWRDGDHRRGKKITAYHLFCVGQRKWLSVLLLVMVSGALWSVTRVHPSSPSSSHSKALHPPVVADHDPALPLGKAWSMPQLLQDPFPFPGDAETDELDPAVWNARAEQVKEAFVHGYQGYIDNAWKADELRPVTGTMVNNFNGWGVTIYDSLDTMWIMGLRDLWNKSLEVVSEATFSQDRYHFAPFFETTIRYLGGMLSAYALSNESILLDKATTLGRALLPAFDTPSGLPYYSINTVTGQSKSDHRNVAPFAEILTCQLEFKYLAHLTGNATYFDKVNDIVKKVHAAGVSGSAFPSSWMRTTGLPVKGAKHFSMGSGSDSGFEYLLKQYLLSSKSEDLPRSMYIESMNSVIGNLLYLSPSRQMLYVTDVTNKRPGWRLEQLSCFLPGLLLLGVHTLDLPPRTAQIHTWAAEGLAQTCWLAFADQRTKLAPDVIAMHHNYQASNVTGLWVDALTQWETDGRPMGVPPGLRTVDPIVQPPNVAVDKDYFIQRGSYLLRPELVESLFIFWKLTGHPKWRRRAWIIFDAIQQHAKTPFGFGNVRGVDMTNPSVENELPSYFFAETLKYLFLTFSDRDYLPLDRWVFNTEAHPFPMFNWTASEREAYGL